MRLSKISIVVVSCGMLAGCQGSWQARTAAFGARPALSPLVRNAPTPHGGVFDIELREPSYAYVFVLVGNRAVLIEGPGHGLLAAGTHRVFGGNGGFRVTPVDVVAGDGRPRESLLTQRATVSESAPGGAASPSRLEPVASGSEFGCSKPLPPMHVDALGSPGSVTPPNSHSDKTVVGSCGEASRAVAHSSADPADAIRLVVIARTTPVKATDLPTFVDLSAAASDASIIDMLRGSLDVAGIENRNWGAVALLVSAAHPKPGAP
jgi:hypothetical protein